RLDHLDRAAAREAILGPLAQYGRLVDPEQRVEIEPALVGAVLDELALGSRVETPYLQLVMERLWEEEREAGSRLLRLSTFRELEAQHVQAAKRQRRLLRALAGAAVLLVLMAGVTVFALTQRGEARSQARTSHARELAATAVSQLPVDPQRSLELAVQAARLRQTPEIEDVLRQSLIESKERAILPSGGPVRAVSFSRDGSLIIT